MAITLITGTPGAGKTAWTVQELTRLPSQRKIYVHGVPMLKIAHEPIYCMSELCDYCRTVTQLSEDETYLEEVSNPGKPVYLVEQWPQWVTQGSLIVIDEVQRIWRPSASKVPDEIAKLETHRHYGLDFWLISQGPHLFHSNIRLLIGRHIHLVSSWRGRMEYEFSECRQNVTSRSDAVQRPYKLPRKLFGLYHSSSLHVNQTHRKPLAFYGLIASMLVVIWLVYHIYNRFQQRTPVAIETAYNIDIAAPPDTSGNQPGGAGGAVSRNTPIVKASLQKTETKVHGCVRTPEWCRCYPEAVSLTDEYCRIYTHDKTTYLASN